MQSTRRSKVDGLEACFREEISEIAQPFWPVVPAEHSGGLCGGQVLGCDGERHAQSGSGISSGQGGSQAFSGDQAPNFLADLKVAPAPHVRAVRHILKQADGRRLGGSKEES